MFMVQKIMQKKICWLLNELIGENVQLINENEKLTGLTRLVESELNDAIDKGFTPSKFYLEYISSKKTDYDKFWEKKIKKYTNGD